MHLKNLNKILFISFSIQVLLLAIIVVINLNQIEKVRNNIEKIAKQTNVKAALAYTMHLAARDRFVIVNDMVNTDDSFERETYLEEFYALGEEFITARNALFDSELSEQELIVLNKSIEPSIAGSVTHHKIINLMSQQETLSPLMIKRIKKLLQEEVFPAQIAVRNATQAIVNLQSKFVTDSVKTAETSIGFIYRLMLLLGSSVVLVSILIALYIIRQAQINHFSMQKAKEDAENANKSKSNLLAIVSHELRTPLTSLIGYNELMTKTKLSDNQTKISEIAISAGKTLLHLINDILDFSKIEDNKLEIESNPFRLDDACKNVYDLMQDNAERKNLEVSCHCDKGITTGVIGDQIRLQQIMTNLLSNAIKFTKKGNIQLLASKINEDESAITVLFEIKDTGIGMESETISELFKPFQQADNSISRRFGGTGLGLTISSKLVQKMGGKLVAYSSKGKGSTFGFILEFKKYPYENIENKSQKYDSNYTTPHLSGRVLVVEDTPEIQVLIKLMIISTGASVTIVNNGKEAINLIAKENYDLILMDMRMPVMNGIDTTKYLRNAGYQMPIVALTANSSGEYGKTMLEAGCTDILHKPINQKQTYNILSTFLEKEEGEIEQQNHLLDEKMLETFTVNFMLSFTIILIAYESLNMEMLKETFHKIKGNAGSFGFPEVSEIALRAEKAIKSKDYDSLEQIISELKKFKTDLLSGKVTTKADFWEI